MMFEWLRQWKRGRAARKTLARLRLLQKNGASIDELILELKKAGYNQGISSSMLSLVGIADAKIRVIESEHWRENLEGNLALQNAIGGMLEDEQD